MGQDCPAGSREPHIAIGHLSLHALCAQCPSFSLRPSLYRCSRCRPGSDGLPDLRCAFLGWDECHVPLSSPSLLRPPSGTPVEDESGWARRLTQGTTTNNLLQSRPVRPSLLPALQWTKTKMGDGDKLADNVPMARSGREPGKAGGERAHIECLSDSTLNWSTTKNSFNISKIM